MSRANIKKKLRKEATLRCLILGDCHLKPVMFDKADEILASGKADFAVQMGDLVDDWGEQFNVTLYERTLKRAIRFKEDHPDTLWVLGNHCQGYRFPNLGVRESGHSKIAEPFVKPLIEQLPQKVIHIVDGVIFTHAGLTADWARRRLEKVGYKSGVIPSEMNLIHVVNYASPKELWQEDSPIWVRPQDEKYEMWPAKLQVVGHTPVSTCETCAWDNKLLSIDTWSTYSNGAPIGDRSFAIVDTKTGEWEVIDAEEL